MTREEREKAIDALKISAPVMAMTQEEFNDYIQTLNKVIDWLEQEPKTGHWKPYLKEGLRYQCSACDSRFDTSWEYCPRCGARMVEPQESEEV